MKTIHEKIKALREGKNLTMEQLAALIGVSWQTVQQWENGKTAPKRNRLEKVAEVLGVPSVSLTSNDVEFYGVDAEGARLYMINTSGLGKTNLYEKLYQQIHNLAEPLLVPYKSEAQIQSQSNADEAPAIGPLQRIPVVGTAQLGDNGFWSELETPTGFGDGYIPFPAKGSNLYALRCRGDSMKPRIKHGEFVIVDPSRPPEPGNEVLVKALDGRVMVKEYLYTRDNAVHLLSVNEAHGKISLQTEEIDCIHTVAGIMPPSMWQTE